jgi:tRNA nucleotidyltransferase (CCA-adding enzyme)
MDIPKSVLKKIKPSKSEEVRIERFSNRVLEISRKLGEKYEFRPMLCGSVAKNTWIAKKNELDLFLLFQKRISRKNLGKTGLRVAKRIIKELNGKYEIAYAEHPYLRGFVKKYQIDIVPCYELKSARRIKTAVDRTPFHVEYVQKNLIDPDEVILLKKFCEVNDCYGADVKTQGFSGYLCELLIIKSGTFSKLVKRASKWRAPTILGKPEFEKFKSPLIITDPVDSNRNVAAAVSPETFYRFVKACKEFVKKPSKKFFFEEKIKPLKLSEMSKRIKKRETKWYLITFQRPKIVDDTLYPQMRRFLNSLEKILNGNGFRILSKNFWCNKKCALILEMEIWQVPKISKNMGPNVYSRHAEEFLKHYKKEKLFIEKNNWIIEKKREFTIVDKFLRDLFKMSTQDLKGKGVPNKIAPKLKGARIHTNFKKGISKLPKEFRVFMRKWFEEDLNIYS